MRKSISCWMASLLLLLGSLYGLTACSDKENTPEIPSPIIDPVIDPDTDEETAYATQFAKDVLGTFYVWNEEIAGSLPRLNPDTCTHPIAVVADIRYKNSATGIEDKWTSLTNDLGAMQESTQGVDTTYGMLYKIGKYSNTDGYFMIVAAVYADSPAAQAGLKRGDVIITFDGKAITDSNYNDINTSAAIQLGMGEIDGNTIKSSGKTVSLTAIKMYQDPVFCHRTFDVGGKKVGYLCYGQFDLKSTGKLIDICTEFKMAGVKELILDLRYNGGGYVVTEMALASMLAPADVVKSKALFEKEVYNSLLTQNKWHSETYFQTSWNYTAEKNGIDFVYDTSNANIGLQKVYGLISSNTASASEALLGGLMPYMEVELIGANSHGKYCTGQMLAPENVYKESIDIIKDWGIYVMLSIYQNAEGKTPCMPNGLTPDKEAAEGLLLKEWGDENDPLLRAALESAGKVYDVQPAASGRATVAATLVSDIRHNATFGKRIGLPSDGK